MLRAAARSDGGIDRFAKARRGREAFDQAVRRINPIAFIQPIRPTRCMQHMPHMLHTPARAA